MATLTLLILSFALQSSFFCFLQSFTFIFLNRAPTLICHFVTVCLFRQYLRNCTSSDHNFDKHRQVFFQFFKNFVFWGSQGDKIAKNCRKWKIIIYIHHMPYLRNSIAYDHDLWCTCVKRYLQVFHFFKIFIFQVVSEVKGQE